MSYSNKGKTYLTATELRHKNPCMSIVEIANRTGVSKQRVYQILKNAGLPSRRYVQKEMYECWQCGKSTTNKKFCCNVCKLQFGMVELECYWCGTKFKRKANQLLNRLNGVNRNRQHYLCSMVCRNAYSVSMAKLRTKLVTHTCTSCEKEFTRKQHKDAKSGHNIGFFCSSKCYRTYISEHFVPRKR